MAARWRVYGLKNCDTCRKARKWLDAQGIAHEFRDLRADGAGAEDIERWLVAAGAEKLINRRGTTWRGLSDQDKASVAVGEGALQLCLGNPALMKRPIFDNGTMVIVGFSAAEQNQLAESV